MAIECRAIPHVIGPEVKEILPADPNRKILKITHVSGGAVFLGWNEDPNTATGDRVYPLGFFGWAHPEAVPANALRAKTSSGQAVIHLLVGP